jgi:hypothetical protein
MYTPRRTNNCRPPVNTPLDNSSNFSSSLNSSFNDSDSSSNFSNEPSQVNHIDSDKNKIKVKKKLKVISWNCNGAIKKMEPIRKLARVEKPDVLALQEIKCLEQEANADLEIEGYDVIFKVRTANGGGVALFVRSDCSYKEIDIPVHITDELIGAEIKMKHIKINVFCIYSKPSLRIDPRTFDLIKGLTILF